MDGKTTAIVSHITLIGWVIAFVTNNDKKDPLASLYIRQMLGLMVCMIGAGIIMIIPILGWIAGIVLYFGAIIGWIISLIGALGGKMQPLPLLGEKFQEWFKSIG